MSDEDISLDEKRVYDGKRPAETLFVASEPGLARVSVAADIVGEFALVYRGNTLDVAVSEGQLAIATPDDVLTAEMDDGRLKFTETGFGEAAAVCYHGGLVAAGDGRLARLDGETWTTLGAVCDVRRFSGGMVAAASGIHRFDGTHIGLEDATDVATESDVLAATSAGLYRLGNGWLKRLDGDFRFVSIGRSDAHDGIRAHTGTEETLYERVGREWMPVDVPVVESVVDMAYGDGAYAVTDDGTVLVDAGDGWRSRSLGLPGVSAVVTG